MTPTPEVEKQVYPSADSVTDPHLALLIRLHERFDTILAGGSPPEALLPPPKR